MALIYRCPVDTNLKVTYEELINEYVISPVCYGGYKELCGVLHKYCKTSDNILATGCTCDSKDSSLIEDLYDAGYLSIVGVDNVERNVFRSKERNKEIRPEIQFLIGQVHDLKRYSSFCSKIDDITNSFSTKINNKIKNIVENIGAMLLKLGTNNVRQANFESECFSVVIDRGGLDMVYKDVSSGQRTESNVTEYFKEIQRLLKVGGRYLCFSVAALDILDKLMDYFSPGWFFRVHLLGTQTSDGKPGHLPVFCFVLTKTKFTGSSSHHSLKIIEMCLDGTENIQRVGGFSDVKITVQEIQQYFVSRKALEKCHPGQHLKVDLYSASGSAKQRSDPRYSMTAVDIQHSLAKNGKFAIFIVPQGRETEWLFSSVEGQKEIASNAGFERVVIATLGRGHTFTDMGTIKKELSTKVMELGPKKLSSKAQVPFLSVGEDLGNRVILHEGKSALSGDYVVEDVDGDGGQKCRRLIFLSNKNVVQSEARLFADKASHKKRKGKAKSQPASSSSTRVDHGYLACQHHRVIVTGLAWIEGFVTTGETKAGLIVGLGGGGLAMFLYQFFKQLSLEVVELDPSISEIAKSWFEFKEDERMKIIIEDGLKYIQSKESHPIYDVIIFDVDSKDTSVGMSCPPQAFVDRTFLTQVHSLLTPSGVFILNLVCRNTTLRDQVMTNLHTVFPELYSINIEEEVNEIIMALPQPRSQAKAEDMKSQDTMRTFFRNTVKELEKLAKRQGHSWDPSLDMCELVQTLRIV